MYARQQIQSTHKYICHGVKRVDIKFKNGATLNLSYPPFHTGYRCSARVLDKYKVLIFPYSFIIYKEDLNKLIISTGELEV